MTLQSARSRRGGRDGGQGEAEPPAGPPPEEAGDGHGPLEGADAGVDGGQAHAAPRGDGDLIAGGETRREQGGQPLAVIAGGEAAGAGGPLDRRPVDAAPVILDLD